MRIHVLQHVFFEGLGSIATWAQDNKISVTYSQLYANDSLPSVDTFDFLAVMGGPMNIYEEAKFPWLAQEKRFIKNAIDQGKIVLGVCLGAQLIADTLGAKVTKNQYREIGWFPLTEIHQSMHGIIPEAALAMHWHGDTFTIPPGAERLASSAACPNQGFAYKQRVIGLQFHLETTPESLAALIDHSRDEITPDAPYIQSPEEMMSHPERFIHINQMMSSLLDHLHTLGPRP